jgi:hypothetical protein
MLVHPLLGFPLPLHLELEYIVIVCQTLLLDSTISELHVHTNNGEESTRHLNEDPTCTPALFPLGLWWWCCSHRVRDNKIVWKVFKVDGLGYFRDFVPDLETWEKSISYLCNTNPPHEVHIFSVFEELLEGHLPETLVNLVYYSCNTDHFSENGEPLWGKHHY